MAASRPVHRISHGIAAAKRREKLMLEIRCPTCEAVYDVPAESLGTAGRKVRCAACKTLWLARADEPVDGEEVPADESVASASEPGEAPQPAMTIEAPATPPRRRPWHQRVSAPERPEMRRGPVIAAVAIAAVLTVAVGVRKSIVGAMPEMGRVYAAFGLPVNLSGLDLQKIKGGLVSEGGVELLVVQGDIVNVSPTVRPVPRLKFAVLDARGIEIYSWTAQADAKDLKPGESQTFRRRLASPPPEGAEVLVRFVGRDDLVALAK